MVYEYSIFFSFFFFKKENRTKYELQLRDKYLKFPQERISWISNGHKIATVRWMLLIQIE